MVKCGQTDSHKQTVPKMVKCGQTDSHKQTVPKTVKCGQTDSHKQTVPKMVKKPKQSSASNDVHIKEKEILSSVAKVSPFCLMLFLLKF
jgi:hypothetical protein